MAPKTRRLYALNTLYTDRTVQRHRAVSLRQHGFGGGDSRVVASRISKQEGPGSIPGGGKEV